MKYLNYLGLGFAFTISAASAQTTTQTTDIYQTIYNQVDQSNLQTLLKDMTGVNPVTVNGTTFSITDRYLPASKANFRTYWTNYYTTLGMQVNELDYKTKYHLEQNGHNVEAVLPGKSPDSIIIIVHYDSIGPHGADNPGVDDDMTGMSTQMETARILNLYKDKLNYTVRFVAADYEEWGSLEGATNYTKYIKALATTNNFKIIAGIDNEQSGWLETPTTNTVDLFPCGGATDSTALGQEFVQVVTQYSHLATKSACMGRNSDMYALWAGGIPALVFSEHDPMNNPHFDQNGGDTYDKIAQDYFFHIAQVGVTYAAKLVGVDDGGAPLMFMSSL